MNADPEVELAKPFGGGEVNEVAHIDENERVQLVAVSAKTSV